MTSLLRLLAALALAICLALPGVGDDGGENGGGTGVWVLPRATYLTPPCGGAPRASLLAHSIHQDCVMQVSEEVGAATASFVDNLSGVPCALPVVGTSVRIPAALLQSLAGLSLPTATVLIADAAQIGYVIHITVNGDATATIRVE